MRILVVSDSHKMQYSLFSAIESEPAAEVVYFLGDGSDEYEEAVFIFSHEKAFIGVRGNCDMYTSLPSSDIRTVCNKKIMAVHGYEQNVKFGLYDLQLDAVSNKCDIVLFGHTHTPLSLYKDGIYYFNPGALKDGCYGVIDITDSGIICINKKLNIY